MTGTSDPTTVTMNGNKNVTAVFTAVVNPLIQLSNTNLSFSATSGGTDPASQTVNITNGGTGTLSGLSRSFPDGTPLWLSTGLNQSTTPAVLTVSVSMSNPLGGTYGPSTYTTRIAIASANATNSPQYINVTFTILPAAKATLHIVNSTHYDLIDIRLDGTQYVTQARTGVLVGNFYNVDSTSSHTVTFELWVGFWDGNSRVDWFGYKGTVNVTVGNTTNLTFNNPTIGKFLAGFGSSGNWSGPYYDANFNPHSARFNFTSSGTWTFYDDNVSNGSGAITLVSWPNYATIVPFKICSTCETILLAYPFGSCKYKNGPDSWPIIEYTAQ